MTPALSLPQALLLLTLKDESGRPKAGFYKPAIAGAAISELLLLDTITLTDDKKPKVIVPAEAQSNSVFLTLAEELCGLGALRKETSKVFGLFTVKSWPEASPKLEGKLKARLETAMFGTGDVDERTCVIIALAKSADVLRHNFDRSDLKTHKARIKAITAGELYAAGATAKAIKAAQAAIIAVTTAAVAASAASS